MIEATVICDSVNAQGKRLTTCKLRYPKFIHGEFMTHRMLSRNASSSRAIPVHKLIAEVEQDALRAEPVFWGKNQKGMQAVEEHEDPAFCKVLWKEAAIHAVEMAEAFERQGLHKQIVNRLLEPFSHINVIASATEWDNFFGLRLHRDAQPEMRALALAIWEARKASQPKELKLGQWHLPFIELEDERFVAQAFAGMTDMVPSYKDVLLKVSVARCARVSYESYETGQRSTVAEDLKLYERLVGSQPIHASPAEHQATPDRYFEMTARWAAPHEHGNYVGWKQYRKTLMSEACAPLPEAFE
jgi:thymidylate synthase ThyX